MCRSISVFFIGMDCFLALVYFDIYVCLVCSLFSMYLLFSYLRPQAVLYFVLSGFRIYGFLSFVHVVRACVIDCFVSVWVL